MVKSQPLTVLSNVKGQMLRPDPRKTELISRVLKYGNIEEWAWLVKKIGKKGLSDFLKNNAYKLDDRTFNWWRIYCLEEVKYDNSGRVS